LDELGLKIGALVNDYAEDIKTAMEKTLNDTAQKVLDYIQTKAPRSGQSDGIADSFVALPIGTGINKTIAIYSEKKGRLTHLLEFGFTHRGGKFVGPRPFMRPAFDAFAPEMLEQIKAIIERGN
jgi:hypothetical protein